MALFALAACTPERAPSAESTEAPAEAAQARSALEPSGRSARGVALPEGLDHAYDHDEASVFRTDITADRVLAFFVTRHPDASLERIGQGGVLRGAEVELDGVTRHVDVSVLGRSNGGARVKVTLLPKPTTEPGREAPARPSERMLD